MDEKDWGGSFAIPLTPFDEEDRIDEDLLRKEIQFCIESNVGGLVVPVMVSEFRLLSEKERRLMIRVPVEEAAGKVPVIANCAAVNTPLAVSHARYAQDVGAQAVIAMPPYTRSLDFTRIYEYYQAISEAVQLPVWIQNAGNTALSTDQVLKICTEFENVRWVKEEVPPSTHHISALLEQGNHAIEGVMGGAGGRYLIHEWQRGARGCIHACQFCDIVQRIWELLEDGCQKEAEDLFEVLLPALVAEGLMGMAYAKEIMIRRGIFENRRIRSQASPLDQGDMREIDRIWERLQPHLLWK